MGLTDKISGRVKQAAGDLSGDESLRRKGKLEERKADAKEELREEHDKVVEKAREVDDLERRTR